MGQTLQLIVDSAEGQRELTLDVARVYNIGFTMRDTMKMQRHLDELEKEGVSVEAPTRPPIIFPISPWATLTAAEIEVQGPRTSGEIEIVTIDDAGELYVGVGSDQTDRALEQFDIPWAKQVAPNVLAPTVWRWVDVEGHWDEVTLQSTVVDGGERVVYQRAGVAEFWTPTDMLDSLRDRTTPVDGARIVFGGTVVAEGESIRYGREWTLTMDDPVLGRRIQHAYSVAVLGEEISP